MSQDVITTANILVDSTSSSPVAVFVNPVTAQTEALVVSNVGQGGNQICHVARNQATDGGWTLNPLFGGQVASVVAAGTAYPGSSSPAVYGFFQDDSGVSSTQLQSDGATWSTPQSINLKGVSSGLSTAYSPDGRLVLYGNTSSGDLFTAYQPQVGGAFVSTVCVMNGALTAGDFQLCLTDESTWNIAANINGKPFLFTGDLGATEYGSMDQVTQFQGTLKQIVLGYWSDAQNTLIYLLVDSDNALHVWASNSASAPAIQQIPNSTVASATGHVGSDGSLNIYTIDNNEGLWVLHQSPSQPWNDDGTPNWAPYIAIDTGVATIVSDANPADAPSLFALDASDFSLRLHAQDSLTKMWKSGAVLQSSAEAFEVVRFRAEINIIDAEGNPLPLLPVTLRVADTYSATDLWVAGKTYPVNSQTEVELQTDATGKLTLAVLTTAGMVTPELVINSSGLPEPLTIQPAGPVHTYLSGTGPLNPTNPGGALPVFDSTGNTLAAAKVAGQPLAPAATGPLKGTAAAAIQNTAMVGLGTTPPGLVGYAASFNGAGDAEFKLFHTQEDLEQHLAAVRGGNELGGFWDDIAHFFGDVWEGIKNGLIKIADFVVSVADKVANFAVQIGNEIAQGVKLALKGLEQAAHFIAGVFQAVAAEVEKVIDWLKALFDFAAIWRTKMAFEQALIAAPAYIKQLTQQAELAADGWFSKQQKTVDDAFAKFKQKYTGQSLSDQPNWQQPGSGPSTKPVAGGASPSDCTNNVHHNWLQDKVSSYSPADNGIGPDNSLQGPWSDFSQHIQESGADFLAALTDFKNATLSIIQDPKSAGSVAIPDLLDMVNKLIDGLLMLCDGIVDAFMTIAGFAMDSLDSLINTELNLGFLNTLWGWIASAAGYGDDNKLTMSALMSLLAAFPTTVIYKLVDGVDNEPFPDGKFPAGGTQESLGAAASGFGIPMPYGCRLSSAVLQILYVIPAGIGDAMGNNAPWWITAISIGWSITIWALANGYPDLSGLQWTIAAVVVSQLLWIVPTIYYVVESVAAAFLKKVKENFGDIADVMITVYGVGRTILAIILDIIGKVPVGQGFANVLIPFPAIFGFLNMSQFRDDPEVAPFAILANLLFDFIGYVGGGVIELVDVSSSSAAPEASPA